MRNRLLQLQRHQRILGCSSASLPTIVQHLEFAYLGSYRAQGSFSRTSQLDDLAIR